jgi:hypothetical protein
VQPDKAARHTTVKVDHIPLCDVDPNHGNAYADAKIPGGPWGYLCKACFNKHGCKLGLGLGQELHLR